jgi:hypothetical protein
MGFNEKRRISRVHTEGQMSVQASSPNSESGEIRREKVHFSTGTADLLSLL